MWWKTVQFHVVGPACLKPRLPDVVLVVQLIYLAVSGDISSKAFRCTYNIQEELPLQDYISTLAQPWIFVLGQRFDHYECGRLSWLGQLYGAL